MKKQVKPQPKTLLQKADPYILPTGLGLIAFIIIGYFNYWLAPIWPWVLGFMYFLCAAVVTLNIMAARKWWQRTIKGKTEREKGKLVLRLLVAALVSILAIGFLVGQVIF